MIPCKYCQCETPHKGPKMCDKCWELQKRIESDPVLARKMLNELPWTNGIPPIGTVVKTNDLHFPEFPWVVVLRFKLSHENLCYCDQTKVVGDICRTFRTEHLKPWEES